MSARLFGTDGPGAVVLVRLMVVALATTRGVAGDVV